MAWQEQGGSRTIGTLVHALGRWVLDTLAPPRCLACRAQVQGDAGLCAGCWSELALIEHPSCPATGMPLTGAWAEPLASLSATTKRRSWHTLRAATFYHGVGRALVHGLKFHDDHAVARLMAHLMTRRVRDLVVADMLVAPVPLHWRRLWWRRFNQSAILARLLARALGLEHVPDLLLRTRHTTPQTRLSGRQRRSNLKGAFAVNPRHAGRLQGQAVLLVDDVLTTGATAEACTRALLQGGAGDVHVAVFALAGAPQALHT